MTVVVATNADTNESRVGKRRGRCHVIKPIERILNRRKRSPKRAVVPTSVLPPRFGATLLGRKFRDKGRLSPRVLLLRVPSKRDGNGPSLALPKVTPMNLRARRKTREQIICEIHFSHRPFLCV